MKIPDCTLTTAIFDLTKFNSKCRSIEEAINNMKCLLETPCFLVIYGDSKSISEVKKIRNPLDKITVYKEMSIDNIWSFKYIEKIKKNREIYWPTKDDRTCAEYHALVCNKFDFVLETIDENPFNTTKFGWIDSSISNKCQNYNPSILLHNLSNITEKFKIQILNVVDKKYKQPENKKEYYLAYRYLVCGCLFTCGKDIGCKILNRLKKIYIETTEMGFGHGEEMFYLEVLDEFFDDIERTYGDYGQVVNNFNSPILNIDYIYHHILKKYQNMTYPREMYYCAKTLIKQIDDFQIWVAPNIHLDILFCYYLGSFYYKPGEALGVVEKIKQDILNNPQLNNIYQSNKEYFDRQFSYVNDRKEYISLLINGKIESFKNKKEAIDFLSN
jgi:hypothetical protein